VTIPSTNTQTPYIQGNQIQASEQQCAIRATTNNMQRNGGLAQTRLAASSNAEQYGSSQAQQASSLSTSAKGTNQLPYNHGVSQAPSVHQDYSSPTSPDNSGQSLMQHSTISPSGRQTGGLYSSSLSTLHENIEETPTGHQSQRQGTTGSHHPLSTESEHDKHQVNFRNQYAQQQSLDTKPQIVYTNEPQIHDNHNLTCGSQQTNVLDKTRDISMENPQGKENFSCQDSHTAKHNPAGDISQQQRQGYPESSRANVLMTASNAALSHPPHTQQEHMNMQGEGGINGNSRRIPIPKAKESDQGRVHIHTAPHSASMHSTQPPQLSHQSHQPQSVYNQSNIQTGLPSRASEVTDGQSAANGNVPHVYDGAMDNRRLSLSHKAKTAPQYLHSTAEEENNMSYYRGSQSGSPNAFRRPTAQQDHYQNEGPSMNVQSENQYQTQQSHPPRVDPHTAGSSTFHPLASHWVGYL
jgi:hypothetical protein